MTNDELRCYFEEHLHFIMERIQYYDRQIHMADELADIQTRLETLQNRIMINEIDIDKITQTMQKGRFNSLLD